MPEFEKELRGAGSNQIGADLGSVEIEHYAVHDRPDLVPDTVSYYSAYRLATPERVLFLRPPTRLCSAPRVASTSMSQSIPSARKARVSITANPPANSPLPRSPCIRQFITEYLDTDPKALHPIFAPRDSVRNVHVLFARATRTGPNSQQREIVLWPTRPSPQHSTNCQMLTHLTNSDRSVNSFRRPPNPVLMFVFRLVPELPDALGNPTGAGAIANNLAQQIGASTLDQTPRAQFLSDPATTARFQQLANYAGLDPKTAYSQQFITNDDAFWRDASRQFVASTNGEGFAITGSQTRPNPIMVTDEIPAALANPNSQFVPANQPNVAAALSSGDEAQVRAALAQSTQNALTAGDIVRDPSGTFATAKKDWARLASARRRRCHRRQTSPPTGFSRSRRSTPVWRRAQLPPRPQPTSCRRRHTAPASRFLAALLVTCSRPAPTSKLSRRARRRSLLRCRRRGQRQPRRQQRGARQQLAARHPRLFRQPTRQAWCQIPRRRRSAMK